MASINEKLDYISETKSLIKNGLNDLGAEINDEITFREYAEKIENLYEEWPKVTDKGTEITLTPTRKGRMQLDLKGNTEQISYEGKNLLKPEYFYPVTANGYNSIMKLVEEGNNYLTFEARPGNQSSYNIIFPCKPNTNYVYKCEKIILYDANDEIVSESGGWNSSNTKAFSTYTLQDTTSTSMGYTKYVSSRSDALSGTNVFGEYVKFTTAEDETECCIHFQGSKANKIKIINPMLYEGTDTDIDYEPYVGGQPSPNLDYPQPIHVVTGNNIINIGNTNYPINLNSFELCKIGNYQDKIVKYNGVWKIPNKIVKIDSYNEETITTPYISTTGGLDIGATIYYVGNAEYTITDTTLISQLNTIEKAKSSEDQTNISQTNADLPFIINATALLKNS